MSMEFGNDNEIRGGGGLATGIALGNSMNRRDDNGQWIWAVIVFIIFVVIALVFLAFMKDGRKDGHVGSGDYAGLLAAITAAKCADGGKGYDHDHLEIKDQIQHSEDRAQMRKIDSEIGAMGMLMQKTAADNEKENLKEFGEIKATLGMQSQAITQILTVQNNQAIINGVIQQLMCGKPCIA